ncbi:hypothetical protein ABZY06_31765 [Streptomyces sp. NPDC006540]|uniref:hypothetical protein n=1 Tax=Streptomyces sp. NPDC006540 TaxID=3155353 RepID=UPI0033A3A2B7
MNGPSAAPAGAAAAAAFEHFIRALWEELFGRGRRPDRVPQVVGRERDLTKIEDVVAWVRHLLTDDWWANGRTIFLNSGYTTR